LTSPVAGEPVDPTFLAGMENDVTDLQADAVRMGCTLRRAAAQTLPDATNTTVSWDTEDVDTDSMWAVGTPTVITIPEDGVWAISATTDGSANTTGRGYLEINITSTGPITNVVAQGGIPVGSDRGASTWTGPLVAGDTFIVVLFMDMAGAANIAGANLTCYRVAA